jgi:malto-oligosyltrehalose synthase/4-alpha-glucanotransferase
LQAIGQLVSALHQLHQVEEAHAYALGFNEFKQQLASDYRNPAIQSLIRQQLTQINLDPAQLQQLADDQEYRLCHWQETDARINFRRFFTVNGLICLNIQVPEVFDTFHRYIRALQEEGVFQGLRLDHIDGLYDPTAYLEQLRALTGPETYIVAEKILEPGEQLPPHWPIQGTSGYEFLAAVNNLFTDPGSREAFTRFYQQLVGSDKAVAAQIREKKTLVLNAHMGGEWQNLYKLFLEMNLLDDIEMQDLAPEKLKQVNGAILVHCPVYRYYGNRLPLQAGEAAAVQDILDRVAHSSPGLARAAALLARALLEKPALDDQDYNERAGKFYQRLMQFTGPLMAKGVEDTLMYTYNRFIGHNEVGDAPGAFGFEGPAVFHQLMLDRQQHWPLTMNATSTHDTKRGEDVRARLNVLTDLPEEWLEKVQEWQRLATSSTPHALPDSNDAYFIYQTLLGAYPMPGQPGDNWDARMGEYLPKALREAKVRSNWTSPDEAYEQACIAFAASLQAKSGAFWQSFAPFHHKVAGFGIVNSLAQVLLKFTCPGVPDTYQGTELYDLSLVDPDNRRPVDYDLRRRYLEELDAYDLNKQEALWADLWANRFDGRIKLWLTRSLLTERKNNADLFAKGEYLPLAVEGACKDHVLAFLRKHLHTCYLVVVPLHLASLCSRQGTSLDSIDWQDTRVLLPKKAPGDWQDMLLRTSGNYAHELTVQQLFATLPLALIRLQVNNDRGAGILLHITSLPSPFGIGDLGPEARFFINFLEHCKQKYWQLLPLNPTEAGQGYSPYSSISSRAGNPLLISPESMAAAGLLPDVDLQQFHLAQTGSVDYQQVQRVKDELLDRAWQIFQAGTFDTLRQQFTEFKRSEGAWLQDFALFMVLKNQHGGAAWFQWPDAYKHRDPDALAQLADEQADAIEQIKWVQFIFHLQWHRLRTYCNNRGIQLFGDMPFYISYDSVDVWGNRELFALDAAGNMTGVAGVPPDDFSDDGQLWGMPVFRWDVLRQRDYDWWVGRLRKNMELYDLVRLDHFRAFADYWEVPAGEETARKGVWKPGPGADFFTFMEKALGGLPFVAEDLGEINDLVLKLRDDFQLPGMKILQFAFGDEMPQNDYIPHNYGRNFIAYTGTHDNNTVLGWYRQEGHRYHAQIEHYLGRELEEQEI